MSQTANFKLSDVDPGQAKMQGLSASGLPPVDSELIYGVDGAGLDFKVFGDTSGAYMMWDQSLDTLNIAKGKLNFSGIFTKGIVMGTTGGSGSTTALGTLAASWYGIEMSVSANLAGYEAHAFRAEIETTTGTAGNIMVGRFDALAYHSVNTLEGINCTAQILGDATIGGRVAAGYVSLYTSTGLTITRTDNDLSALMVQHAVRSDPGTYDAGYFNAGVQLSVVYNSYCDYGMVFNLQSARMSAGILFDVPGDNEFEVPVGIYFDDTFTATAKGRYGSILEVSNEVYFNKGIVLGTTGGSGQRLELGTLRGNWYGMEICAEATGGDTYEMHGVRVELRQTAATSKELIAGRFDALIYGNSAGTYGVNATAQVLASCTLGGRTQAMLASLYAPSGLSIVGANHDFCGLFVQHYVRSDPNLDNDDGYFNAGIIVSTPGATYCDFGLVLYHKTSNMIASILIGPDDSAVVPSGIRFEDPGSGSAGSVTSAMYFDSSCGMTNLLQWEAAAGCVSSETNTTHAGDGVKVAIDVAGTTYYLRASTGFS